VSVVSADAIDGRGDCFIVHLDALMLGIQVHAPAPIGTMRLGHHHVLVHGTVDHERQPRHWHCWLESDDGVWVIDISNGHRVIIERPTYYEAGHVQDVKRYTRPEIVLMTAMHNHAGPWHRASVNA